MQKFRLLELKQKLDAQKKHLEELAKNMYVDTCVFFATHSFKAKAMSANMIYSDEMTKTQGGEHN